MAASHFAMTIGLYLFCSLVSSEPSRMFVPLLAGRFSGSSNDNRIAMSCRNSLVPFRCTVVAPYEWVWFRGSCLFASNIRPFHDELDERVWIPFLLLFFFRSQPPLIQ